MEPRLNSVSYLHNSSTRTARAGRCCEPYVRILTYAILPMNKISLTKVQQCWIKISYWLRWLVNASGVIYLWTVSTSLHLAWCVADAKCIVVKDVCVFVCLSVCLSLAAFPHYCTDPDVTWGNGTGCLLVVHYIGRICNYWCTGFVDMTAYTYVILWPYTLQNANAYSVEREMSASACTRSMAG